MIEPGFYFLNQWISWLEIIAMITGVVGVWLTLKQNVLCFPIGIINVSLYAWLFFTPSVRLYADATLQCIYFILLLYGWYIWSAQNKEKGNFTPSFTSKRQWIYIVLSAIAGIFLSGYFLQNYTDADLPWLDSTLTVISLAAQWMIAKKKIENWLLWIIADIVYIPMYIYKGLPLTAVLYFLFLILAWKGWREWRSTIRT